MRKLMLACVPCPVLTTFAKAQSVENVVQDFRLIGAWASDCYKPPDPRNEHATFSKTPSGNIQLVNVLDPTTITWSIGLFKLSVLVKIGSICGKSLRRIISSSSMSSYGK